MRTWRKTHGSSRLVQIDFNVRVGGRVRVTVSENFRIIAGLEARDLLCVLRPSRGATYGRLASICVFPSVAQKCGIRAGTAEKHHRVALTIECEGMTAARRWADILYLRPMLAIETPGIAAKGLSVATPE